jgi:hypothetical protein
VGLANNLKAPFDMAARGAARGAGGRFSLTCATEYGLKASQTDNWRKTHRKCPFPAGFLIQLSEFFPAERRFLWESRPAFI